MAFTTNYLHIDGSLMIDGSIFVGEQPFVNGIDKASQSYVDGSINDLWIKEYNQDASVTHLQSAISSGLIYGGLLSINTDVSKYDISSGYGFIIDNHSNPLHPTIIDVSWNAKIGNSPINLLTELATYVSIDVSGSIVETISPPDSTQRRNSIYLGTIVHSNHIIVNAVNNQPVIAMDLAAQVQDLMQSLGFRSISGNQIHPNDADLKIKKDIGVAFKPGANFQVSNTQPHMFTLDAQSPVTFRYRNQNSSEGPDISDLDPTTWDASGTTTTITNSAYSTIQRVYIFPSNLIRIQRGQKVYTTLANAFESISTETFILEKNIGDNALFLGSIVLSKNCTDLSDPDRARFIPATGINSTGIVSSFPTLQQSYDISSSPQITGILTIDGSLYATSIPSLNTLLTPNSSTATEVRFDKIQGYIYGTTDSPITDNLTMSASDAILGVTDLIISKKIAEPTYPVTFKKLSGIYDTCTNINNFIYVQYLDPSTQVYTINQII
ncbi:MAG: hypothetical protein PHF86_00485 [Candidatus Nanoarchaeia archaeon]|nr:hypothetical protein [Candidatus Nanoarchaeia archaeon]